MHLPTPLLRSFLPSTALLLTTSALAAPPVEEDRLPAPYPDATRGEAAIATLGDGLPAVAARNGLAAEELAEVLRHDESAWVDAERRVFFVDDIPAAREEGAAAVSHVSIPSADAFTLHSRPGAQRTIYLDFTGHHSVNNAWDHDIVFPPFDFEGGTGTFTEAELQSIISHWQRIAEDYAPFDVDVTTEEPPVDRLIKGGFFDQHWGVRDVHTQAAGGFGNGIGGIAYLNSFTDNEDTPVFTFNKGDNNGSLSGSHEVGHALGLYHDGIGGSSYHSGVGSGTTSWGPIMGAPFGKHLVQWSNGDYPGATNTEDDYAVITQFGNGVALLADDHGDVPATATPIAPACPDLGSVTVDALIEIRTDQDAFSFESPGGLHAISVDPTVPGGNLDALVELYGPTGSLVASNDPSGDVVANLAVTLGPGTHTIIVDGVGKPNVYSDYGSVGVYSLTLTLPVASSFTDLGQSLAGTTTPALAGSGYGCAETQVALSLSGAVANAPAWLTYGAGAANVPFLGGTLVPDVAGPGGGLALLATDGNGDLSLAAPLPSAVPSGVSALFQYWVADAGGPQGFAASNAVELTLP